ncbi:hypothetical protein AB6V48_18245, partial [Enterobacter hormaechei]
MAVRSKANTCRWLVAGLLGLALYAPAPAAYAASIEAGFSPEGTALQLVLKTIESAQHEIRLMGYSFTSPEVVSALVRAKHLFLDFMIFLFFKCYRILTTQSSMIFFLNAVILLLPS